MSKGYTSGLARPEQDRHNFEPIQTEFQASCSGSDITFEPAGNRLRNVRERFEPLCGLLNLYVPGLHLFDRSNRCLECPRLIDLFSSCCPSEAFVRAAAFVLAAGVTQSSTTPRLRVTFFTCNSNIFKQRKAETEVR